MLLIWKGGVAGGTLSIVAAVAVTLVVGGAIVAGFVAIVRARSVRLPPAQM
jgi:hypothetical protein